LELTVGFVFQKNIRQNDEDVLINCPKKNLHGKKQMLRILDIICVRFALLDKSLFLALCEASLF